MIGCTDWDSKFCAIPGPKPVPPAVKTPSWEATISIGAGLERRTPLRTVKLARPRGALDGKIALI